MSEPAIPVHADYDRAPGVMEGATEIELSPHECDVEFWIKAVAQGSLRDIVRGRRPDSRVSDFLREPGPLRDSLISEFSFRSLTEVEAARICSLITAAAPDVASMEFYATQAFDEARHADAFRSHLVDLGVPREEVLATVERVAGADARRVIDPLWAWGEPILDEGSRTGTRFIDGVVMVTVLLEGVLAPTAELSERKWKGISEATAEVERGACVDEIRHLSVGSWIVREHVRANPGDVDRLVALVAEGRDLWAGLPTEELVARREQLFQEGIEQHRDAIGDHELVPGRRLVDTTVEERLQTALDWSAEIQGSRLRYMGLDAALPRELRL